MTKQQLPTINKYLFALGVRNLGDGRFGYATELDGSPGLGGTLQGQALVVGQTDENGDPIWEELETSTGDDSERTYVIPEQCIDDRGWCTMRWRFKTTQPASVESGKWVERVENFTPVGYGK